MRKFTVLTLLVLLLVSMFGSVQSQEPSADSGLVEGNNQFVFDLYHATEHEGNFVFAPYSVSQALAMTYAGARGDTATQMADVMHFDADMQTLGDTFGVLNADLMERGNRAEDEDNLVPASELSVANALWGEQTFPFHQDYLDLVNAQYGAAFQLTDFIGAPEEARVAIKDWVEAQTHDRIQDIVPEGIITEMTRLVLANAVYFKALWANQFNESATTDDPFTLLDDSSVDVPMMHQTETFATGTGEGYKAIALPYYGYEFAMLVVVPEDFGAFAEGLSAEQFAEIHANLTFQLVELSLPKFTFTTDVPLGDTLVTMGMTNAFDPAGADFSGMAEVSPEANLFISQVLHKAFIEVNEEGTEAAGATVVIMDTTSAPEEEPVAIEFTVDQPFFFTIYDQHTGSILFWGQVTNPLE